MTEQDKPTEATSNKSSGMKPVVIVGIVCLVLLFIVGTALSLGMKFFAKKAGTSVLQGVIENQTGVKTNLTDIEKGKFSVTDTKTGQTVNVGGETLPDTFPKDFPVYPGAKVAASVSNIQQGKGNGMLVTFTTPDGLDKVVPFYKSGLSTNGWTTTSSFDSDTTQTWAITKGTTEGSVSIVSEKNETTIQVVLGQKE